jgi:PAS domain S-box-containing protein
MSKSGSMNRRYPPEEDGGSTPTAPEPRVQTSDPSLEDVTPAPVEALDRSSEVSWVTRCWRVFAIGFGALILGGTAVLAIEHGKVAPLFIAALAAVVGASALIGGRRRRAFASRYSALEAQLQALRESHSKLRIEIAERDSARRMAEQNEAAFRTVFEASLDVLGLNRLSDGAFITANQEFTRKLGYTVEDMRRGSPGDLGMWTRREQLRRFMAALHEHGFARETELELRTKEGRIIPGAAWGTVIESRR